MTFRPPGRFVFRLPIPYTEFVKHSFDLIFQTLYDIGRQVDLEALRRVFPQAQPAAWEKGRDTPASIRLPRPLILPLLDWKAGDLALVDSGVDTCRLRAKIYEEGVLTLECCLQVRTRLSELHTFKAVPLRWQGQTLTPDQLTARQFEQIFPQLRPHLIQDQYNFDQFEQEHYRIFCLTEAVDQPQQFILDHRDYLASFLLGEDPAERLHRSQIDTTLQNPFSFRPDDLALFDLSRAFLISPRRDYDDLLQIIEHANYQLLELRTLDKLLDRWLDDAENTFRQAAGRGKTRSPARLGPVGQKLSSLQPLRLDALFLLENLENSSRIIGDYYLGQVYDHLCKLFNTQGWKVNVEKRLDILQDIYTMTKSDQNERTLVILEFVVVLLIGIEIIALFFPLH